MFKKISFLLSIFCVVVLSASTLYAADADDVLGVWQTTKSLDEDKAVKITVYKCGEKYCGKYTWMKDPERVDANNEDASKKGRKLMGTDLVWGYEYDGDGEYDGGTIYSVEKGKTFKSNMKLKSQDELYVEGCVAFFCGGNSWYRSN